MRLIGRSGIYTPTMALPTNKPYLYVPQVFHNASALECGIDSLSGKACLGTVVTYAPLDSWLMCVCMNTTYLSLLVQVVLQCSLFPLFLRAECL